MTNLVEKGLLIGFGIFTLILFFSVVIPFTDDIFETFKKEQENLNKFITLRSEIDNSILYVVDNPSEVYYKHIYYPRNLNITISFNCIKYDLLLYGEHYVELSKFEAPLLPIAYVNMLPQKYKLNISSHNSKIFVEILMMEKDA